MAVKLNSTGGGSVTLDSPSTASNYTVTLPSAAGTLATTTGTGSVFTNPTINGFTGDTTAITIGTTQFVKDTSGNVGIGTASPSTYGKFVVNNSIASNNTVLTQALLTNRSYATANNGLSIVATTSNGTLGFHDFGAITFNEAPNSNGGSAYINMYVGGNSSSYGSNPRFLQAYSSGGSGWADYVALWAGGTERARITSAGDLLVGDTAFSYGYNGRLFARNDVNTTPVAATINKIASGNVYGIINSCLSNGNNTSSYHFSGVTQGVNQWYLYGNGTSSFTSDERKKKNIETTRNGYLEDLCKLRVVKYNWWTDDDGTPKELGLIAQEVEQIFPGLITNAIHPDVDGETYKVMKGSVIPFMLLKAIQELSAQNNALEARLAQLEAK